MSGRHRAAAVDRASWPREMAFRLFSTYANPHFAVTSRIDATRLLRDLKPKGITPYRACLYAFGAAINAVPELRTRFRGGEVMTFDVIDLSATVPVGGGNFAYSYIEWAPDWVGFNDAYDRSVADARAGRTEPNTGARLDLAYFSCMPWLDFTAITNAMPGPQDCIPRVSWGRFADHGDGRHSMAAAIEVHHAIADGYHVSRFFEEAQRVLDGLA
jgi:chloramphenicol O-acetyltransferase type A